jgi:sec-independent protein translocase protein TatB
MFDVGFWELSLIMVVALLVIGPERLPGVARKAGLWVNKGRSFLRTIKSDIEHEIAADELKKVIKNQSQSTSVHEIIEEVTDSISELKESVKQDDLFSSLEQKQEDEKANSSDDKLNKFLGKSNDA